MLEKKKCTVGMGGWNVCNPVLLTFIVCVCFWVSVLLRFYFGAKLREIGGVEVVSVLDTKRLATFFFWRKKKKSKWGFKVGREAFFARLMSILSLCRAGTAAWCVLIYVCSSMRLGLFMEQRMYVLRITISWPMASAGAGEATEYKNNKI